MIIEHEQIKKYIPHRHPFLLVDRVIEIEAEKRIVAIKNVSGDQYFFAGHFPDAPVMPGVLMVEALAQASAILAKYSRPANKEAILYLAGMDKVRFKRKVVPGDTLRLEVDVENSRRGLWKMNSAAYVGDQLACKGLISAMMAE